MSTILCLFDIHHKIGPAQKIMDSVKWDKCILHGDYFDDWGDCTEDAEQTAVWLRDKIIPNPNIIRLLGNHDQSYFYSFHPALCCSGYTQSKERAIKSVLTPEMIASFKFFYRSDGWLHSHAGLTSRMYKDFKNIMTFTEDMTPLDRMEATLNTWIEYTMKNLRGGGKVPLLGAGYDRGGSQEDGGITWCDWDSFNSTLGVNQIFGHSKGKVPRIHYQNKKGFYRKLPYNEFLKSGVMLDTNNIVSVNYCVDTKLKHYALITDGKVELFDVDSGLELGQYFASIPETPVNDYFNQA